MKDHSQVPPEPPAALGLGLCGDLLTAEDRAVLQADLRHMAQQRRRAEAESASVWLA